MKKKLLDLRFTPLFFEDVIADKLGHLLLHLGRLYLSKINYTFQIENTGIIEIFVGNSDNPKTSLEEYNRLGDCVIDNIGATRILISENQLLSLNDDDKRTYLIHNIHNGLLKYAIHFNEDVLLLEKAYQKLIDSDFFVKHTKPLWSPDKTFECWVERKVSFEGSDYRFALLIKDKNVIEHFYLCNKAHLDSQKLKGLAIADLITIPRFFGQEEWMNNNEFKVTWGSEQYVFNVKTKLVAKQIDGQ